MLERLNLIYRLAKCVTLNNAKDIKGFESRLDDLEDAIGKHLDRRLGDMG